MNAPRGSTKEQSPSQPLHALIPTLQAKLPTLDVNNMGSLNGALARRYTKDRIDDLVFEEDGIFSGTGIQEEGAAAEPAAGPLAAPP
jgi:hypothetical protein